MPLEEAFYGRGGKILTVQLADLMVQIWPILVNSKSSIFFHRIANLAGVKNTNPSNIENLLILVFFLNLPYDSFVIFILLQTIH
jgi:hypothetical protein